MGLLEISMKNTTKTLMGCVLCLGALLIQFTGNLKAGDDGPRFEVESNLVQVPVVVIDKDGNIYGGLEKSNFTILEDGIPQEITTLTGGESPITITMLLEHSRVVRYLLGEVLRPAGIFVTQIMDKGDFASIISFETKPRVLTDFTRNRQELIDSINSLSRRPPSMTSSNLYDAIAFTLVGGILDRVEYKGISEVKGRTGVLLVASGIDTMSDLNFDQVRNVVASSGVPVYSIGVGELAFTRAEPYLSGLQRLEYLQAKNVLRTLSEDSGGRSFSVRFQGALDTVLESIEAMLSHQFTLAYRPSRAPEPGEKRSLKVLVDLEGDGHNDNERLDLSYRHYYYVPNDDWEESE
jgi:VWFA-related protein